MTTDNYWKKCSSCKEQIGFKTEYYSCSVSTCSSKRTGYVFCSVSCWEQHLPFARHKDAAAISNISGSSHEMENLVERPKRRIVLQSHSTKTSSGSTLSKRPAGVNHEILIVVSKLKQYILDRADMNTAGNVMNVLSQLLRHECDKAIDSARQEGRKTVMDRDFNFYGKN